MKQRKASRLTRNPHTGRVLNTQSLSACKSEAELIFEQWKSCEGAPISDWVSSARYDVSMGAASSPPRDYHDSDHDEDRHFTPNKLHDESGLEKQQAKEHVTFPLADLRIWGPRQFQPAFNEAKMRLEFFFDGSFDYDNDRLREIFTESLRTTLERNLAEGVQLEFREVLRQKLQLVGPRPTPGAGKKNSSAGFVVSKGAKAEGEGGPTRASSSTNNSSSGEERSSASAELADVCDLVDVEGGSSSEDLQEEWNDYLHQDVPSLNLEVDSFRESGCMIQFVGVRTTVSLRAATIFGQQTFPDYFKDVGVGAGASAAGGAGGGISEKFRRNVTKIYSEFRDRRGVDDRLPGWVRFLFWSTMALFGLAFYGFLVRGGAEAAVRMVVGRGGSM